MDELYKAQIVSEFIDCISRTISRLENEETNRPFHRALLSEKALFWSRFERSFSTSFGQRAIEKISAIAVRSAGATQVTNQKTTEVGLTQVQNNAINAHIESLRGNNAPPPRWELDFARVNIPRVDERIDQSRVISDLWWVKDGINHYMSIKTVKPNIDQTAEAKRDLLKLKVNDPNCRVFFGLYYNPYGESRADYSWSPPKKIFDLQNDEVILIGKDYWDTLGGNGFYEELLEIAEECGERTRAQIDQLGI